MMNAMTIFVKDYVEVMKVNARFCKNHWKGLIVLGVVTAGVETVYLYKLTHKDDKIVAKMKGPIQPVMGDEWSKQFEEILKSMAEDLEIEYKAL